MIFLRHMFLFLGLTLAIGLHVKSLSGQVSEKPNVIVILADDMGYGDLSCYNDQSKITTLHLDRLASEGMRFTDAHSGGSTCIPSRYSLLTGQFAIRMQPGPARIRKEQMTIASMARAAGYETHMVGKWHLGFDVATKDFDYDKPFHGGPVDRGFDHFFGMHASLDIPPYFYIKNRRAVEAPNRSIEARSSVGGLENWNNIQGEFWRAGKVSSDFQHSEVTPRFFEQSIQTIKNHATARAAKRKPLLLYLALPSPHTPWLPSKNFRGKSKAGMYGDFVLQVDDGIGRIMTALKENKMDENTIVIFSSDNGPVWYEKDTKRFGHRSTGPLRGMKFSSYEGGHRMPLIVRWPSKIQTKSVCDQTIAFADILPTLADVMKFELPEKSLVDGVSFLSQLKEPNSKLVREQPIIHDRWTIRSGKFKLVMPRQKRRNKKNAAKPELYNLSSDPSEKTNIESANPQKVAKLQSELKRFQENISRQKN